MLRISTRAVATQSPHSHNGEYSKVSDWPYVGKPEGNFCRNPGRAGHVGNDGSILYASRGWGKEAGPWCYTTDPKVSPTTISTTELLEMVLVE